MEVGGRDSDVGRDVAAIGIFRRESVLSLSFRRSPILVLFLAIGLSRYSILIGLKRYYSSAVDDSGGFSRVNTLHARGAR